MNGKNIYHILLRNKEISVVITNLGCSIVSIDVPDKQNVLQNIVSGCSYIEDYGVNPYYMGCVIGRYANRIAGGKFVLEGKQLQLSVNDELNHLHGGFEGFHKKIWDIKEFVETPEYSGVVLAYLSRHGEEGYPGNCKVSVYYCLNNQNQLSIEYRVEVDQATPVNLTNHSYFNLTGFKVPVIYDHLLQVNGSLYTEKNERNIPTGKLLPVADTPLDFRKMKKIGTDINNFPIDFGYDHNYVLDERVKGQAVFAAKLFEPESGRSLKVFTTQPGLQVYTANYWDSTISGLHGIWYKKHGAVALETQYFPDSPNHNSFPDTTVYPGKQAYSKTMYEFDIE